MEVILKQDIDKLGSKDDLVKVKPGYARNYLIPQGLAIAATPSAIKVHAENQRQRTHKLERIISEAKDLATKLEGITLSIGAKAGENGKIFGSVNTIQIADAIAKAGYEIDRKQINIQEESIKELGAYEATVKLYKNITATVKFNVVGE
jgi:large subunit ribosomal protein L9